ncbi:sulfotransferase [Natronospira sp.]|uniref:tetratricopeptide repeat-containing sulfotransferase family protein n=1 Tax=Natronospira sp. TaxID=2024970 RepID=UPI003872E408
MSRDQASAQRKQVNGTKRPELKKKQQRVRDLRSRGDTRRALNTAAELAKEYPNDPECHFLLGLTLTDFQRFEAGQKCLERSLELAPKNHGLRLAVCQAMLETAEFEKLLDQSDNWSSLPKVAQDMGAVRAAALCELGRRSEAELVAKQILSSAPQSLSVYRHLLGYGLTSHDERFGRWLEKHLSGDGTWEGEKLAEGYFLLADYYHQRGEHEKALTAYIDANEKARPLLARKFNRPYRAEQEEKSVASITKNFPAEKLNNEPTASVSDNITRPVFILGMPRSGKSLVEYAIGAHPRVSAKRELPPFTVLGLSLERKTGKTMSQVLGLLDAKQRATIGARYLKAIQSSEVTEPWSTDTNPINLRGAGFLWATVPGSRIVLIKRDPLDLAFANFAKFMPRFPHGQLPLFETGHRTRMMLSLIDFWAENLGDRCLVVEYESFVREPEVHTRRVLELLDLPWDDSCRPAEKKRVVASNNVDSRERAAPDEQFVGLAAPYRKWLEPMIEGLGEYGERYRQN